MQGTDTDGRELMRPHTDTLCHGTYSKRQQQATTTINGLTTAKTHSPLYTRIGLYAVVKSFYKA